MTQPMNPQRGAHRSMLRKNSREAPSANAGETNSRGSSQRGRQRIIDISKSGEYKSITFQVSEEFDRALKLACVLTGMTQTELIISQIKPEVNKILEENGIHSTQRKQQ